MKLLITAGPTHEPIDAVRYIANRSSGRMGLALASAALDGGHDVTLLWGPATTDLPDRLEPRTHRFASSRDLQDLLEEHFPACETLIMAAAVADYRPAQPRLAGKLPREDRLVLDLVKTPDLVAQCAARKRPGQRIIAFALEEPATLIQRASTKLARKGVDAIVANPLAALGHREVRATILTAQGATHALPEMDKARFAQRLIAWLSVGTDPAAES